MKIIDNGKEYIYTTPSGERETLEYGSILIRMGAILKNVNIEDLYKKAKRVKRNFDTDTSKDFFVRAMIFDGVQRNSGSDGMRLLDIFYDEEASPQRELIIDVIEQEIITGKYKNGYEVISDKKIPVIFEKILMGEKVKEALVQKLLNLGEITYSATYNNNIVVKGIELKTLGQIISLEVENVISRKNPDVIYRRCIQCGNIFVTCGHAGNQDKLCSYNYSSGLCKKKRQAELNEKRDRYYVIDRKIYGCMYKRKDKVSDVRSIDELHLWQNEYQKKMKPYKDKISEDEYWDKAKATWKSMLGKINSKE